MKEIQWQKWASVALCIAAAVALAYLGIRLLLVCLLPFLPAWLLSLGITPLAERMASRFRLPQRLCACLLLTLALVLLSLSVSACVNRLFTELERLLSGLAERDLTSLPLQFDYFNALTARLSFLHRPEFEQRRAALREQVNAMVGGWVQQWLLSLQEQVPKYAAALIAALPSVLLFTAVTVISSFYFCTDRRRIEESITELLPLSIQRRLPAATARIKRFSGRFLRAYLLLLLLTQIELFVGLSILGVDYALLIATLTAVVDLLPILGVGTVLVPWGLLELLRQNYRLGLGLLILYLVVTVLHQILESRLVGKSIGLHPLFTLAASYIGLKTVGLLGMLLGPLAAVAAKELLAKAHPSAAVVPSPASKKR